MLNLKTLVLFTAVLCANLEFTIGLIKTVHYTYYKPENSDLYVNLNTFWSSNTYQGLTTVTCPSSFLYEPRRNCTVTSHIEPKKSCPVTFNTTEPYIEEYLEVFPFGHSRAVIFWGDRNTSRYDGAIYVKYTIVDLDTCQSKQFDLGSAIKDQRFSYIMAHATYVVRGSSLEFIARVSKDNIGQWNKYHIDSEGNFISKLEPWRMINGSTNVISAFPIVVDSEITSFVSNCWVGWEYRLILSRSDGSEKVLMHSNDTVVSLDISTTDYTIGIALVTDFASVNVGQFDMDGNLKLNRTFKFQDTRLDRVALLTLPDGFIVIAGGCKKDLCHTNTQPNVYHMLKVSSDGKIIGAVKNVEANPCNLRNIKLQLFGKRGNYCVAFLCSNVRMFNTGGTDGAQFTELLVKCYDDDEFTDDDLSAFSNATV